MAKSILNDKSIKFLESYLNNAAPTGYEWEGQKINMKIEGRREPHGSDYCFHL